MDFSVGVGVAVVAVVLSTYVATLYPSIPGGDSGELVAEACHLGVAHPPGYPLFVLAGHAVLTALGGVEDKSPAWKINAFNALLGSLCAACIFSTVTRLVGLLDRNSKRPAPSFGESAVVAAGAAVAATAFAFSPLAWLYSVGAEVFALNNFLVALLVLATVRFAGNPTVFNAAAGAFLCGLTLCNQHTSLLFEMPLVLWIFWVSRKTLTTATFALYATMFFVGIAPYAFLWVADTYWPQASSWGDCSTLAGFWHHFRRADYGTFRLYSRDGDTAGLGERLGAYAADFAGVQVPGAFAPFAVVGAAAMVGMWWSGDQPAGPETAPRRKKPRPPPAFHAGTSVGVALLAMLGFYLVVFHTLSNMPLDDALLFGVHARFWMQPNVLACVLLGVGVAVAGRRVVAKVPWVVAVLAAVGAVVYLRHRAYHVSDQSANFHMANYARSLLEPLPPNSVLITGYDQQWTTARYLSVCEAVRPDVTVLNAPVISYSWFASHRKLYPHIVFPGTHLVRSGTEAHKAGGFSTLDLLVANENNSAISGGIFWAGNMLYRTDTAHSDVFDFVPHGMASKGIRKPAGLTREDAVAAVAAWDAVENILSVLPNQTLYDRSTWEWTVPEDFAANAEKQGSWLLEWVVDNADEAVGVDIVLCARAARMMEVTMRLLSADKSFSLYKNLGIAYARMVQYKGEWPPDLVMPSWEGLPADATFDTWKTAASQRTLTLWEAYLAAPGAERDASFSALHGVVKHLKAAGKKRKKPKA